MAIYGILLVFNDDYRVSAIEAFQRFMGKFGAECKIIIINNNPNNVNIGEFPGDNINWEFSGWDKGISLLQIREEDVVVFANDTFKYHRSWGLFDQLRFEKSIKKLLIDKEQGICGEVHKFSDSYEVLGRDSDRWVCTYLFALTGGVINKIEKISLSEPVLSEMIININNNKIIWGGGVSMNIQSRIQKWLYPTRGVLGWRKSSASTDLIKLRKAKTILNEKWISAYCLSNDFKMIDAGPNAVIKKYRNMKYRLSEVVNKIKYILLAIMR